MQYVYPVVSRRAGGLSIGLNLSPTARCLFACVYCQVAGEMNIKSQKREQEIDIPQLESELREMVCMVVSGELFQDEIFRRTPTNKRILRDIAFSGDGEPTLCSQFPEIVQRVVAIRAERCPETTKLIAITNGSCLELPSIREALRIIQTNNGEVWAKLDAGTEEHFRTVSRSSLPYEKILSNLVSTAKEFPIVIQSCFLSLRGITPSVEEVRAYITRLREIADAGGTIQRVQVYTVARQPPEPWVRALSDGRIDEIAATIRRETNLVVETFYSR